MQKYKERLSAEKKSLRTKISGNTKPSTFKNWLKNDGKTQIPSRDFLAKTLQENRGSTILDIGAGTGAWSEFLAPYAKQVTALEPSEAMRGILNEKIEFKKIDNIKIEEGNWPGINIEPHDYLLASHSMYGETDFEAFIKKMILSTQKTCFLVLKVLFADTIMAKASQRILGQPFDSPCFQIAYNALLQMDIYPNVLMETDNLQDPWFNNSIDEAMDEIKNRMDINNTHEHDHYLTSLLQTELVERDGKFFWPVGNRSALVYWDV